jgi:uncharacterized protein (TIGR02118 family)
VAVRLIALYHQPSDPGAFDTHYAAVHSPIVRRYPGLRDLRLTKLESVSERLPAYYLMAEMSFDSRADLDAALASDPGKESGRDLRNFAQAGVELFVANDDDVIDG